MQYVHVCARSRLSRHILYAKYSSEAAVIITPSFMSNCSARSVPLISGEEETRKESETVKAEECVVTSAGKTKSHVSSV